MRDLPTSFSTPEIRIDTTEERKLSLVRTLKNQIESLPSHESKVIQANYLDGVRLSFPNGWALVRASNTQPVIVMRFESSTQEGLEEIRSWVQSRTGQMPT